MATIVQAVQSFLREMEWHWEQLDEHRLRVLVIHHHDGRGYTQALSLEEAIDYLDNLQHPTPPPKRRTPGGFNSRLPEL